MHACGIGPEILRFSREIFIDAGLVHVHGIVNGLARQKNWRGQVN